MNSLKEEANEYEEEEDRIRVYLNVKPSKASDKLFYNISKDKKSISLLDNISLDNQKKWKKIEVDQIFTYKDENAYIYEEVMLNCIKNSLDGENFTFISYGDSDSEKHQLIIGTPDSYENINNRGLFPRLLENYINKIDSNEILSDTISLNLSYFLINNNNIIDLAQFMGRETKTLEKISREELLRKYSKEIKIDDHNNNYLKSIKKAPVETSNDSLFFLLQILNLFYKYEEPSNHFLNWSYFNIILYVTDNNGKTVSTISFIILPGNEILNQKIQKRRTVVLSNKKDNLLKNISKEFNNTIEDIIEQLDYKSLKEQWSTLDNVHQEEEKIEKPTISNEEAEVINEILVNYHGQEVTIKYFRNGQILEEKSVIRKIDAYDKKIYLTNRRVISMHDLLDIKED